MIVGGDGRFVKNLLIIDHFNSKLKLNFEIELFFRFPSEIWNLVDGSMRIIEEELNYYYAWPALWMVEADFCKADA